MWDVFMKVIFGMFILPGLMAHEGYVKLNAYLKKRGMPKITWFEVALVGLIIILIILLSLGYRW